MRAELQPHRALARALTKTMQLIIHIQICPTPVQAPRRRVATAPTLTPCGVPGRAASAARRRTGASGCATSAWSC